MEWNSNYLGRISEKLLEIWVKEKTKKRVYNVILFEIHISYVLIFTKKKKMLGKYAFSDEAYLITWKVVVLAKKLPRTPNFKLLGKECWKIANWTSSLMLMGLNTMHVSELHFHTLEDILNYKL